MANACAQNHHHVSEPRQTRCLDQVGSDLPKYSSCLFALLVAPNSHPDPCPSAPRPQRLLGTEIAIPGWRQQAIVFDAQMTRKDNRFRSSANPTFRSPPVSPLRPFSCSRPTRQPASPNRTLFPQPFNSCLDTNAKRIYTNVHYPRPSKPTTPSIRTYPSNSHPSAASCLKTPITHPSQNSKTIPPKPDSRKNGKPEIC